MSKIIVTGATGNAGTGVLSAAFSLPNISQITALTRRAPFTSNPKLETILLPSETYPKGFDEISDALVAQLGKEGYSGCVWAQGISQVGQKEEDYVRITHDYPLEAARAFAQLGTKDKPFRFVYVSGEGADQTEKSGQMFSRTKGRTEKALVQLEKEQGGRLKTVSVRPGGIYPIKEHAPRMSAVWRYGGIPLGAVLKRVYPSIMIDSVDLGRACLELAREGGQGWELKDEQGVISNVGLRKLASELRRA